MSKKTKKTFKIALYRESTKSVIHFEIDGKNIDEVHDILMSLYPQWSQSIVLKGSSVL